MFVHTFTPSSEGSPVCNSIASFASLFSSPVLSIQASYTCILWQAGTACSTSCRLTDQPGCCWSITGSRGLSVHIDIKCISNWFVNQAVEFPCICKYGCFTEGSPRSVLSVCQYFFVRPSSSFVCLEQQCPLKGELPHECAGPVAAAGICSRKPFCFSLASASLFSSPAYVKHSTIHRWHT